MSRLVGIEVKLRVLGLCAGLGLLVALLFFRAILAEQKPAARGPEFAHQLRQPSKADAVMRAAITSREVEAAAQAGLMPPDVKSVLVIKHVLKHGEYVWNEQGVPEGRVHIWVDLRRQTASVFRAGHEVSSTVIVYGADEKETPLGTFEILSKHRHYRSRSYNAEMPYSLFITRDGIALHGSVLRPRHATHGCVGLPEEFAQRLFEFASVGSVVEITRSDSDIVKHLVTAAQASIH